jgi:hypothetical protein
VEILEIYDYSIDTAFSWVDTSAGETVNLHDDDNTNRLLPFDFPFYGEIFDTVYIDANGFLCFTPISGDHYSEIPFPMIHATYSYCIAAFWDDIIPNDDISILSTPHYWVISWSNVTKWSGASTEYLGSFQILLFENGDIKFQYQDINTIFGGYTTGINLGDGELGFSYEEITDSTEELAIMISHDLDRIPDQPEFTAYPSQPNFESVIPLQWGPSPLADSYYLYRTSSEITTLAELSGETPIYSGPNLEFTDNLIDSGIYYYTIIAGNEIGNSSVSSCLEVEANLLSPASPTLLSIEDPIDTEAQIKVTWSEVDGAQTYYVIMENETITSNIPNKMGFETTDLEYEIDVTANQEYFVVIIASNIHGNSTISNCLSIEFTSIVDPHIENLPPTITHPEDIEIELSQLPYEINWTITDATVSVGVYRILVNGTVNVTGNWNDQMVISFEITDFAIGNYTITIEVEDGENSAVVDSVFLSIIANSTTDTTDPGDPEGSSLGIILGSVGGGLAVIGGSLFLRRKRLQKSKAKTISMIPTDVVSEPTDVVSEPTDVVSEPTDVIGEP